jgi:hypothetical protein
MQNATRASAPRLLHAITRGSPTNKADVVRDDHAVRELAQSTWHIGVHFYTLQYAH